MMNKKKPDLPRWSSWQAKEEFEGMNSWSYPEIKDIMNVVVHPPEILPLLEIADAVMTTKFTLIPLFLVLIFLKHKHGLTTVEAFQAFYDEFYDKSSNELYKGTEFILNFLVVASGIWYNGKELLGKN